MDCLTVDFETYYDAEYSLRKMTTIEYIKDSRFQVIMMSYALNDEPVQNVIGHVAIQKVLDQYDWSKIVFNAQNTQFDATIAREHFGKTAAYYTDTMAMARVTGAHHFNGASLKAIGEMLIRLGKHIPPKGTEVANASGHYLFGAGSTMPYMAKAPTQDIDAIYKGYQMLQSYVEYCNNDVELAREAFKYFSKMITADEMQFGDLILKAYILPSTYLDLEIIQSEIVRIEERDHQRAIGIATKYFGGSIPKLRATCRSSQKFTEFLQSIGGVFLSDTGYSSEEELFSTDGYDSSIRFLIPERYSEKKQSLEPCYSKSFAGMIDMCEHPDPDIADLFQIKLDMTSSIEMSRAKRFENISKLRCGFGFPYVVSGALSHRLGGSGGLNVQNLSSGRKKGQSNALKRSITAPDGHKIIVYDSSQIELRSGSFIAQDLYLLNMFPAGKDPYSELAANLYGGDAMYIKQKAKEHIEPYAQQRQISKSAELSCIYGTGGFGFRNYLKTSGMELSEIECKTIVYKYRQTHPAIVNTWKQCERALDVMIAGGEGYFGGSDGQLFYYTGRRELHGEIVPSIKLPDGNWIAYRNLRKEVRKNPDGSETLNYAYTGMKEGRVKTIYTYGSKIFENCIAEDTEVLTKRGWVMIQDVQDDDLLFDGVEWVSHGGLIDKGEQEVITLNDVEMTADHRVLTIDGWKTAQEILTNNITIKEL